MTSRWIWPFELREKIGVGGMGVVYRGRYVKDGRLVAVKLLPDDVTRNPTIAARFRREMELLKALKHPNIVQCFGGVSDEKQAFYAMELVEGGTLAELLRQKGRFTPEETIRYGLQMCSALAHAHAHEVIHRDVKPGNFLLSDDGNLKLSDFGIAFVAGESRLTSDGKTVGSFPYMAPEQIRGKPPLSAQTDLYALGCVLFEMLTGRPPFESNLPADLMRMHLEEPPPALRDLVPECPVLLENAIIRLLEKDPEKRPSGAAEVAGWLQQAAGGPAAIPAGDAAGALATVEAPLVRRQPPPPKRARVQPAAASAELRPWRIAVAVGVAVIAGLLVWNAALRSRAARAEVAEQEWVLALRHESPLVRRAAAQALGRLETSEGRIIAALETGLKDPDFGVRVQSARSLGSLGAPAKESIPALRSIQKQDAEPEVRQSAAEAIRMLEQAEQPNRRFLTLTVLMLAALAGGIGWWVYREARAEQAPRLSRSARLH
ncbi:MAG: protein kinase [Planctomycetales bacterium]